jgi:hypothetical protein
MVLPHDAANKEKEDPKNAHQRNHGVDENLKNGCQSKERKPRMEPSNQKTVASNKRKCTSCSAVLCHWEKWGDSLVEAGKSKEESVMGSAMGVVTKENASVRGCVHNTYKAMSDWPRHEQPPDCVYDEIKKLWPSARYSDGTRHKKPSSRKSKRPRYERFRGGEPDNTP